MPDSIDKKITQSYLELRKAIGILGMALPFILLIGGLIFGNKSLQYSISHYYHTNMRDFFIGLLFCISLFLVTYQGYKWYDNLITVIIGITGFGTALFPSLIGKASKCIEPVSTDYIGMFHLHYEVSNIIHGISAISFFLLLAINSFVIFTKSNNVPMTENKKKRNLIYRICGIIIFISLIALLIFYLTIGLEKMICYKIPFFIETIMLLAFGFSWLVKGETFYKDTP